MLYGPPGGANYRADRAVRFERPRVEFRSWVPGVAGRFGYAVQHVPVGPEHPEVGPPTAVFELNAAVIGCEEDV